MGAGGPDPASPFLYVLITAAADGVVRNLMKDAASADAVAALRAAWNVV